MAHNINNFFSSEILNFLGAINFIFYVSELYGLIPYSMLNFYRSKVLASSFRGNIQSLGFLLGYVSAYHFILARTYFDGQTFDSGTLTTIIGIFILYMEPIMLALDMIATLINQRHLIRCIQRLELIDLKLAKENITIDYRPVQRLSICLIIIIFCRKFLMILFGYFVFELNIFQLWCMYVPIFVSILSKVWFVLIVSNIRKKFESINGHLDKMGDSLKATKEKSLSTEILLLNNDCDDDGKLSLEDVTSDFVTDFLRREITSKPKSRFVEISAKATKPMDTSMGSILLDANLSRNSNRRFPLVTNTAPSIGEKYDKRLINLCFVHDEICEVSSIANYMFSFQMLMLMAYGFLGITAQLYFVYCSLAGQSVPRLFRSAQNIGISSVLIISTAVTCVYVIYICWQTKNSAEKTGVFMHKLANIVDENHFYELTNHLSLKLMNHRLNFTACGFFDLDMTTIYAITGAITSYLIILIQFNVAAQRSKKLFLSGAISTNNTNKSG